MTRKINRLVLKSCVVALINHINETIEIHSSLQEKKLCKLRLIELLANRKISFINMQQ